MTSRNDRQVARAGFSLVELLIVLAVLAAVAGLGAVAVRKPLAKTRLRSAAQDLQKQLRQTRLQAMQHGQPIRLRYEIDGSRYTFVSRPSPFDGTSESLDADPNASLTMGRSESLIAGISADANPAETDGRTIEHQLPTGIRFVQPEPEPEAYIAGLPGTILIGVSDDNDSWSAPLLFRPDGRVSSAVIRLASETGYIVDLELRGLTGAVTVNAPRRLRDAVPPSTEAATADATSSQEL